MKKKKGFTLVELLATLAILAILASITVGVYMYNKGEVDNTVSEILYSNIMDASSIYYSEFANKFVWHKNDDNSETSCINLNSLINQGFFQGDNEEFNSIKDEKIVIINRNNGVNTYSLAEHNDCIFWEIDSNDIVNSVPDYSVGDGELGGTNISQDVSMVDNKYLINLNFNTKNFEETVTTNDVYVTVVLDESGSMRGTKFNNAVQASKNLANSLLTNVNNSKVNLILFGTDARLIRGFESIDFYSVDFGDATTNSSWTNYCSAFDMAQDELDKVSGENIKKVLVFLTDGACNKCRSSSSSSTSCYNSTNIVADQLKNEDVLIITIGYSVSSSVLDTMKSLSSGDEYYYSSTISGIESVFEDIASSIKKEVSDISKIKVEITPSSNFEIENISTNGTINGNTITYEIDLANEDEAVSNVSISYLANLDYEYNDKENGSNKIKFYDMKITIYKKDGSIETIVPKDENIPYIDFITKEVDTSKQ